MRRLIHLGLVGRLPAGVWVSSRAYGSGQASYNPEEEPSFVS
jgi:hypothetical protein